jgi:hypothetical protein
MLSVADMNYVEQTYRDVLRREGDPAGIDEGEHSLLQTRRQLGRFVPLGSSVRPEETPQLVGQSCKYHGTIPRS